MKIRIPSTVPEEEHDAWVAAWVTGYRTLKVKTDMTSQPDMHGWPSAYYSGQKQAYVDMNRSRGR